MSPQQFNAFGITADAAYILERCFHAQHSPCRQYASLYLASFTSYKASEMTIVKHVITTVQQIWNEAIPAGVGATAPCHTVLESPFRVQHLPRR